MAEKQNEQAVAAAARAPAPAPATPPHSAGIDLRELAEKLKAGEITREAYESERDRIRANWSKTSPQITSHVVDHHLCATDAHGPPKGGVARGENRRADILHQLKKACDNGDAQTLKACLRANPGLDIASLEDEGEMPSPLLNLASESGFCDYAKALVDDAKVTVDSLGEFGTTALFDACYFDNWQVAEALLDRGARAEFQDADGSTPLYAAAFQGNLRCLDRLLARKVPHYYHRAKDGLTPLHAAVLGGNKECVGRLVEAGHPLDARDTEQQTPLLAACTGGPCGSNGKKECLTELLRAGADVRARDGLGRNAMQLLLVQGLGCPSCTLECAERLLARHASLLEQDAFGNTAAQHLPDMKAAPKLYALLKRAMKRESLRNKLAKEAEPEAARDAAWLAEQEAQAQSAAAALLAAEEEEKAAEAARRERSRKKRQRDKERKDRARDRPDSALPPSSSPSPPPRHNHTDTARTPGLSLLEFAASLDAEEDGEGEVEGEGEEDGEVDEEIEAFRVKLEEARARPKITLNREAFNSLREGLKFK